MPSLSPATRASIFTTHHQEQNVRGVQAGMKNRLEGFASNDLGDP